MARARYLGDEEVTVTVLRRVVGPDINEGLVEIPDDLVWVAGEENPETAVLWPESLWKFIDPPKPRKKDHPATPVAAGKPAAKPGLDEKKGE